MEGAKRRGFSGVSKRARKISQMGQFSTASKNQPPIELEGKGETEQWSELVEQMRECGLWQDDKGFAGGR